ncbi:MAG: SH3 domain-containing protein, partial [Candidatus Aminicenantes bacterium]|nr:SH3 domain-containing protein [Candidatus Aminicenantes bacterium]
MTKTLDFFLLAALLSSAAACAGQAAAEPSAAVVIMSVENMFRGASDATDVVSQALLGDNVKVLKKEADASGRDWCEIETPDTYTGWVVASSLRFLGPSDKPYASAGQVFVVSALLANTYREPDVTAHKP